MATFKYNDVTVHMNEDTGKFSTEGKIEDMSWIEIKRRIDNAAKMKYKPVTAIYVGYRGDGKEIVTITRPVIGSHERVWITHADKKRDTVPLRDLVDIKCKDEYTKLYDQFLAAQAEANRLVNYMSKLDRATMPEPIEKS